MGDPIMVHSAAWRLVCLLGMAVGGAACSKAPATQNPCDLVTLGEAKSLDSAIVKTQAFPPKKGDSEELCLYYDADGAPKLMVFVWPGEASDPRDRVSAGMKSSADRVVEVSGVGDKAVAGFNAEGDVLKLFAVQSKGGTIGLRVRDPVTEGDEKYAAVKSLAAQAASRLK
jgi:hypothetical protein